MNWFSSLNPILQTLLATIFTWGVTAIGASIVFFFKKVNKNVMDAMLGFSAGVMIAASFFSLLSPAIEMSNNLKLCAWIVCTVGVLFGGALLFVGDKAGSKLKKAQNLNIIIYDEAKLNELLEEN